MAERRQLRGIGWAAAAALVDLAVVAGFLLHGVGDATFVLRAGILGLGAVGLAVLARAVGRAAAGSGPAPDQGGPGPEPERPAGLEELSRLVDSCRSGLADSTQFGDRLRPLLLQLAASRCGRPLTPTRLRAGLGDHAAGVLLGNGDQGIGVGRGPSPADLEEVVSRLEAAPRR
ncbi:MAG TPA: hypothetical protein VMW47_05585 [Verrucomicrobiae bacterium]|nr:hypothetical protein [Verrucomicrobiae bacterium]